MVQIIQKWGLGIITLQTPSWESVNNGTVILPFNISNNSSSLKHQDLIFYGSVFTLSTIFL